MTADRWADARNVLCVRLDTMADVLMTTPALRALKAQRPDRTITMLTSSTGADIACLVPEIDEVGLYDPPWMESTDVRTDGDADRAMIERLRRQRFDAAVIFTEHGRSARPAALLASLADIPLRLAYFREDLYGLLTDWVREAAPGSFVRHEVQRHLDLVAGVGAVTDDTRLSLRVPPGAYVRVRSKLWKVARGLPRPWAIVHPGAPAPSRRYPAASFGKAAKLLRESEGIHPIFTGAADEWPLVAEAMREAGGGVSLAGCLDLPELCALISMADLLVTDDTAPAHIAAAVSTPVVDLYALTNPQRATWEVPSVDTLPVSTPRTAA